MTIEKTRAAYCGTNRERKYDRLTLPVTSRLPYQSVPPKTPVVFFAHHSNSSFQSPNHWERPRAVFEAPMGRKIFECNEMRCVLNGPLTLCPKKIPGQNFISPAKTPRSRTVKSGSNFHRKASWRSDGPEDKIRDEMRRPFSSIKAVQSLTRGARSRPDSLSVTGEVPPVQCNRRQHRTESLVPSLRRTSICSPSQENNAQEKNNGKRLHPWRPSPSQPPDFPSQLMDVVTKFQRD